MTAPLVGTDFGGPPSAELLILGPSLGTSAESLWGSAAEHLARRVHVVAWDLPGHGHSPAGPVRIPELAAAVLALVDDIAPGATFHYAGDSIGGAVGLQLLLDRPERVRTATLLCTGAVIGRPEDWATRAATVRTSGTEAIVETARQRWFAAGFVDRRPDLADELLDALRRSDDESYAQACEALAEFDVTARLGEMTTPLLAVAGAEDVATPPESLALIASGVKDGRLVVLDDVGHLAPIEVPMQVADLIVEQMALPDPLYDAGMTVRRAVLGDAHVDRAIANTSEFTSDFQDLITRYAWGTIWTRPGLDRRSRSIVTLTALVARGHHDELAMHVRAARRNGLTTDEIKEVLLQTAIYCGVPDANTAFRIASQALAEYDGTAL
ncbi:4-carboxymuconolactone decarboxylase [Mycobacterium sp. DBP42]|jgi:3-oxoadipate enol-lactonase/4-carboxymuconolactone decarboxylase|uniref:bifunctional 3-oxoadipate enol-lactonase/4-carboxymuconolactone decarboxylase PcaDC n=1 Tax=Mycobacterium sp. DBP42 TaxID=2545267 RepID=UPI00110CA0FD|nr:4-carboxymuconolactone decarboxylase [Mycobacterium sp. DBP42]TMS52442.1 4-carboxymuconolactone decarboxylase [Mycobacterium sp. DBP42]